MLVTVISDKYLKIEDLCEQNKSFCQRLKNEEIGMSLKEFLSKNKNLVNFERVVVDLDYIDEDATSIIEAIELYRDFFYGRLVLIANNSKETSAFYGKLVRIHQYNNILVDSNTNVISELALCIFGDGKSYQDNINNKNETIKNFLRQSLITDLPEGMQININIASIIGRCGCTTQSFKIYRYLQNLGLLPCYVDANGEQLQKIVEIYDATSSSVDNIIEINGVDMCSSKVDAISYNVLINDIGKINENTAESFVSGDINIICSGAKPWEMGHTISAMQSLNLSPDFVLYMSASDEEQDTIKSIDNELQTHSVFAPYSPDCWADDSKIFYDNFIKPKIKEVINNARNSNENN